MTTTTHATEDRENAVPCQSLTPCRGLSWRRDGLCPSHGALADRDVPSVVQSFCHVQHTSACPRGESLLKRKTCPGCGSTLHRVEVTFFVTAWTGTGRYPIEDALMIGPSKSAAENWVRDHRDDEEFVDLPGGIVVRSVRHGVIR